RPPSAWLRHATRDAPSCRRSPCGGGRRSLPGSRRRSASRLTLGRGSENRRDRVTQLLPLRSLPFQLLTPLRGQCVDPHALLVLGLAPLSGDPSLALEPVQGRVERAGVNVQDYVGRSQEQWCVAVVVEWVSC